MTIASPITKEAIRSPPPTVGISINTTVAAQQEEVEGKKGATTVAIGSSKKSKLFESALLPNAERDELHTEIYNYFKWLEKSLISCEKGGRRASKAGLSITGVRHVLTSLESGFKAIRGDNALVLNKVAEGLAKNGNPPFLERYCEGELKKRVEEVKVPTGMGLAGRDHKTWEQRYEDMIQHKSIINNCSSQEINERSSGLGDWLQKQRCLYAKKDDFFLKNRAPKLDAAGFIWWKQPPKKKKAKPQPIKRPVNQLPISARTWQQHQQYLYTKTPTLPRPQGKSALVPQNPVVAIAVKPKNSSKPYDFETQFNLLLEYKAEHGNCVAPANTRLGRWVSTLRLKLRGMGANAELENTLSDANRTAAAEAAIGDANASSRISVQAPPGRLGLAVQFAKDREGAAVTAVYDVCSFKTKVKAGDSIVMIDGNSVVKPEDLSIGMDKSRTIDIVTKKKASKPAGRPVTQEQIQRLNAIGFNWEGGTKLRSWELSYQDILTYYQTHGDFRVPRTYVTSELHPLGEWVHRQRYRYTKKDPTFMNDRALKLDAIGFEWKPRKSDFQSNFKELISYKHVHGHVNIPCNNSKNNEYRALGRWVASLRFSKKREEDKGRNESIEEEKKIQRGGHTYEVLSAEKIKLLDSIGFDWTETSRKKSRKESSLNNDGELEEEAVYNEWEG